MPKADPVWVKESLLEDALAPVAESGRVPDATAAEEYIRGVLDTWERKKADRKPPKAVDRVEDDNEDQIKRDNFMRKRGYDVPEHTEIVRGEQKGKILTEDDLSTGVLGAVVERVRLIRNFPELYQQIKGLVVSYNSPSPFTRAKARERLIALLDRTDAIVGHSWRSPPPKKIISA